jgi:YesN/AraC family two-component response regulator
MDTLGLSKDEITKLFKPTKATRDVRPVITPVIQTRPEYVMMEIDEFIARERQLEMEREQKVYDMKREAEEKQAILNLQICKKYTDGATLKSLKDEYNVTQAYLNRIFKKYIRS